MSQLKLRMRQPAEVSILEAKSQCPVCDLLELSNRNVLATIFEELSARDSKIREAYQKSNGLCLRHLRNGLKYFVEKYPTAADFLIQDSIQRLDAQREQMKEYIGKHNWVYRQEQLTPQERVAWLRTLTFFTGYPAERFNHRVEDF